MIPSHKFEVHGPTNGTHSRRYLLVMFCFAVMVAADSRQRIGANIDTNAARSKMVLDEHRSIEVIVGTKIVFRIISATIPTDVF
jgi:hypothetical protein